MCGVWRDRGKKERSPILPSQVRSAFRCVVFGVVALCLGAATAAAQFQPRKIGELELRLSGLSALADPQTVTVPKNTVSGVRVAIRAGASDLSLAEAQRLLGGAFLIEGDVSGPGLSAPLRLPHDAGTSADPFLVRIPPLPQGGDYTLSNLRVTVGGATVLDVTPGTIPVHVIDQVLITSVTTRPLTLEEIRQHGIILDNDSYLGFEFTLGLTLDSKATQFTFPVVFDNRGVAVPQPLMPAMEPERAEMPPLTTIVPMLLKPKEGLPEPTVRLPNGTEAEVRIPSVLVIPGNVGYLKQFFSAKLFVANGAPGNSGLTVHDVTGTIRLPKGADQVAGSLDDPLTLPATTKGPPPSTLPIRSAGLDGVAGTGDDLTSFKPAEQGEAEFLLRGEKEGFHQIDFDIEATLGGLVTGPVTVAGAGSGGVLVRNPYFDMTFTAPAVVRQGERFTLFVTVNNISQSLANDVRVALDASRMSGAHLVGDAMLSIDTLLAGDSRTLPFEFEADRTGQLVATYLNLDTHDGSTGTLKYTLGVGERGVPLSPDTLVLPTAVDYIPQSVVMAAMRVLGQAWSVANSPSGTLPQGVIRTSRQVVTQKALALAEAGLRVSLGQPQTDAVRDLLFDFYGGSPVDAGFDQLLRTTNAGTELARAIGRALEPAALVAGGATPYERQTARIAASGNDFLTFALSSVPGTLALVDQHGRRSATSATSNTFAAGEVSTAVVVPFGTSASSPAMVTIAEPSTMPYTLELTATAAANVDFAVTLPVSGGFRRGTGSVATVPGGRYKVMATASDTLMIRIDANGDGTYESQQPLSTEMLYPEGARLISATVIGPETLDGAAPFGKHAAVLFDRFVHPTKSSETARYTVTKNGVISAKRQLSGRLVFTTLDQPEGPYVPSQLSVAGMPDGRGVTGPPGTVTIASKIADIGAVVSGRVINADGTPVGNLLLTYTQNAELLCIPPLGDVVAVSALRTGDDGRYELRYVRQDQCGMRFNILARDPSTGALRQASSSVRVAGEQIVLDIALFGRGSVTGTVRSLGGQPVPGATVVVISQTDTQSGGSAMTDTEGRYRIDGIVVGPVSVRAVKGASLGRSSGRIDRAGSAAVVDLTLDGGTVRAAGVVRRVQGSDVTTLPGIDVVYYARGASGSFIPVALAKTSDTGAYSFEAMPTGEYRIDAVLNSRDRGSITGVAAAGDIVAADIAIVIGGDGYGTVRGFVRFPDGAPASNVIVSVDDRGLLTSADGSFELQGILVKPTTPQQVVAQSQDGLRSGSASVLISQPGQVVSGLIVTLSGLGSAEFTVLDAGRHPVAGQEVALLGDCHNPCGCAAKETDSQGRVRFDGVPLGTVRARATRTSGNLIDQASVNVSLTSDGGLAQGVLIFAGSGTVTGTVLNPDGTPALGADVRLNAKVLNEDSCSLVSGVAQRIRTDANGTFRFTGVNVGSISVTASHAFFTTNVGASGTIVKHGDTVAFNLKLVDTISGALSGTVYLPDGVTPAGGGVEITATGPLPDVTVVTDAAGRFEFAKIFPQGTYSITARDPVTGGVHRDQIYLRASADTTHDIRLKGRGTVRVTVVDGAGQAVATNTYVRLQEGEFPNRVYEAAMEAGSGGVVTFNNVFEGPLTAQASDAFARGGRTSSALSGAGVTLDMQVALTTTGTVTGRFLYADRTTPVAFGAVKLIVNGQTVGHATTAGGDDAGTFTFSFVPAGSFRLEAQDPLTARSGVAVGSIASEGEVVTADVVAQGVGRVEGLITSNGAPQAGAHVELTSGQFRVSTIADGAGRYAIDGIPEGRVVATASLSGGFLSGTSAGTLSGEGATITLDVALRDSGRLTGTVVNAVGGTPAPLSQVKVVVGGTGGATLTATTDGSGAFAFERVPAGFATLTAAVLGGIDRASGAVDVTGAETTNITLTLNGVGSISGTASGSSGEPVAGTVKVTGTGAFPWSYTVQSAADGRFALPQVMAGPFTAVLTAKSGEFTLYGTASGNVAPTGTTNVAIQVQPSGTVTGIVMRSDGTTPAIGANVVLQLDQNRGTVTVQAGSDGRFTARGVPLGAFTVRIDDPVTAGLARSVATLATNGETVDLGTIVLDDEPIRVLSITPANGTTGVSLTEPIVLTFSNSLQSASGITVRKGTSGVGAGSVLSGDGKIVTLTGTWPDSSEITVNVSTAVTDIFGRHPVETVTSRFHTIDLTAPSVTSVTPANGSIETPANAPIVVTFSEPLHTTADVSAVVRVEAGGVGVSGTGALTGPATITFTPSTLADNTTYTVKVTGARDASGNVQTSTFTSTFATRDTVAPVLTISSPSTTAWVRHAQPSIQIAAVETVSGIAPATATLLLDGQPVTVSVSGTSLYYTPPAALSNGTHTLEASVADRAGNVGTVSGTFRNDVELPTVPSLSGISENQVVRGTLSLAASAVDTVSGVARIDVMSNGSVFTTLNAPDFAREYDSAALPEGPRQFTARAVDVAGNVGPPSAGVNAIVDNRALTVAFSSPAPNAPVRDVVSVVATASEPVSRIDFSVAGQQFSDSTSPYEATLDLTGASEGPQNVVATAYALSGETAQGSRTVVVDRTAPAAPDVTRISAEPPVNGSSLVYGYGGAVEANASIEVRNPATDTTATVKVSFDGTFTVYITGEIDQVLELVAIDAVGNRSAVSTTSIRATPSLPPSQGATSLHFDGVLVDRVGAGRELVPDGNLDAVFTLSLSIGEGATRTLSHIDLVGPSTRTTRATTNPVIGVAQDAGSALLNAANGTVSFPITTGTTLTLFTSAAGFISEGSTYTVTAVFQDGAQFIGTYYLVPKANRALVAHSAVVTASPATVIVPTSAPGTTTVTIDDIRDIEGTLIPDGVRIAVSAANMAAKNPGGVAFTSAGGIITDGEVSPNNPKFKVFTISGGRVQATYSSEPITPRGTTGAAVVVQVQAADSDGNVLGSEAIGTVDLALRAETDHAIVHAEPAAIYADRGDRRSALAIEVRDASGKPVPDGTKVLVTAANSASTANGSYIASTGGQVVGGVTSPSGAHYRVLEVHGGLVEAEYSANGLFSAVGEIRRATIQVLPADANGARSSLVALGTGDVYLVGAGSTELSVSPSMVPWVAPVQRPVQIRAHHVHDARSRLVPDGAKFLISAANSASVSGCCYLGSHGGTIHDGTVSPTGAAYKVFSLGSNEIRATYSVAGAPQVSTGESRTATIQVLAADPTGARLDIRGIGHKQVGILGPMHSDGSASHPYIFGDGSLFTSDVRFENILDVSGNPLPDGSFVVASAANSAVVSGCCYVGSTGGQILNGDPSPTANFKLFRVASGAVDVIYGNQNIVTTPGVVRTAMVALAQGGMNGERASNRALGLVPITITGNTSATATASLTAFYSDGIDYRSTITVNNFKDSLGNPVPDGTLIGATASSSQTVSGCCYVVSAGGKIIGDQVANDTDFKLFPIINGQVVFEYSSEGVVVSSGEKVATIQIASASQNGDIVSNKALATVSIRLLSPASATVITDPVDVTAYAPTVQSQVTVQNIQSSDGVPLPDDSKIALSVRSSSSVWGCCYVVSAGGTLASAGTKPDDGTVSPNNSNFQYFTIAGGEVKAVYDGSTIEAGVNEVKTAIVQVVSADRNGATLSNRALGVASIRINGISSTTATGPASVPRAGGTATVTFGNIRDAAGNVVPDGTPLAVTVAHSRTVSGCCWTASAGGTITNGNDSPSSGWKWFTVQNGAVTVEYSTVGASSDTVARLQIVPARPNGTPIGNRTLDGGMWAITLN